MTSLQCVNLNDHINHVWNGQYTEVLTLYLWKNEHYGIVLHDVTALCSDHNTSSTGSLYKNYCAQPYLKSRLETFFVKVLYFELDILASTTSPHTNTYDVETSFVKPPLLACGGRSDTDSVCGHAESREYGMLPNDSGRSVRRGCGAWSVPRDKFRWTQQRD